MNKELLDKIIYNIDKVDFIETKLLNDIVLSIGKRYRLNDIIYTCTNSISTATYSFSKRIINVDINNILNEYNSFLSCYEIEDNIVIKNFIYLKVCLHELGHAYHSTFLTISANDLSKLLAYSFNIRNSKVSYKLLCKLFNIDMYSELHDIYPIELFANCYSYKMLLLVINSLGSEYDKYKVIFTECIRDELYNVYFYFSKFSSPCKLFYMINHNKNEFSNLNFDKMDEKTKLLMGLIMDESEFYSSLDKHLVLKRRYDND